MRILILTFYYPPDLSAGSFRVAELVKTLEELYSEKINIEIVTTEPNRYATYTRLADHKEVVGGISVHRIKIPKHNSRILDQAKAFVIYAVYAIKHVKNREFDLVFSTSGRLMTATLGAFIAKNKKLPLYLDMRDIFVDTIQSTLPLIVAFIAAPIFSLIERYTVKAAIHINLVSPGFKDYFEEKYPNKSFSYFSNGIDEEFLTADGTKFKKNDVLKVCINEPLRILYAGNIGDGQGLHKIVPMLAKKLDKKVKIRLIGGGGRLEELNSNLKRMGICNVEILPPIARMDLISEYQNAHVLFLHLNNYDAFERVLPSKIFEYAAVGKPILAGVSGFAANFLTKEVLNSAVFDPCDVDGAITALERLEIRNTDRSDFVKNYLRKNIMKTLAVDIVTRIDA
ncbi:glycosyltransferase family 4 protein [Polynucleobacter sp. AP-Ainpum-60-G11]|uniref:glycosyltransferase family 4 protein n=1 Tax=Polynucleobacter sp. AP-Ainpum-60-G11 TaxID=2576926 RepID=UPI001BFCE1FC|nr:glycosyltransferase family 4 protein [Polynucleobacter sp. AP-Ainpum-60-G11]QWE27031.1 glycosyltransferase family 4 protein [Polynucleobacter sp. AP-Ainpum-60-G11]